MNKISILLVEDDPSIARFITTVLTVSGYEALHAKSGSEALLMSASRCPDVMLLDLGLPDTDGMKIISSVRSWSALPIIVISARTSDRDKVLALDAGADDYITKPFGSPELLARIRTALRHAEAGKSAPSTCEQVYRAAGLTVDPEKRLITLDGKPVHFTQIEYKLVTLLARYSGKVLTYDYLSKSIWGPNCVSGNQILRVNMANIRRKIEKNPAEPEYIFTELGVGYRMRESD